MIFFLFSTLESKLDAYNSSKFLTIKESFITKLINPGPATKTSSNISSFFKISVIFSAIDFGFSFNFLAILKASLH